MSRRVKVTRRARRAAPRGMVIVAVLTCLLVAAAFALASVRAQVERLRVERQLQRQDQAEWLAESALERAIAQVGARPEYSGETWLLTGEQLSGGEGKAEITVERSSTSSAIVAQIVAWYPADHPAPARAERRVRIPMPPSP